MSEIHYGLEDADVEYVKTIEKCHFYGVTDILPEGSCFGENRIGDIWQFTPLNRAIIWYQDRWHLLPTIGLPSEGSCGYSEPSAEEKADEEHDKVIAEMFTIIEDQKFPDEHYNRMARAIDKMEEYKEILDKKEKELTFERQTLDKYRTMVEEYEKLTQQNLETMSKLRKEINSLNARLNECK